MNLLSPRALLTAMAAGSLLAVAAALFTQYAWDMQPCAWCVLQRLVFVAVAASALLGLLLGLLLPGAIGRRIGAGLAMVLAGAGLAAALWQHFVASQSASCKLTLADKVMGATGLDRWLPEVFAAYANCADAKVDLAGLPYEWWSAALFIVLLLAALRVMLRPG